ncbi:4'-phosphopantetheinyl transferase family protein [Lactiplantibacillus pentosus]|uniref:4'-phosphopantetheinyl transferase family protein n=1 Tax=Lactiplantibacillus pentosus TaxID=1589 RepID=UPI0021A6128D|nr:4'-phosphopantetheinyl transferase superfamily protein [Lactiplantibacillus pentosus]MCT3306072.1 4'-phosphopantetheinyl transferase superfamily protein [Lactiplantibacillus pentosus]
MVMTQVRFAQQWLDLPADASRQTRRETQRLVSRSLIQQLLPAPLAYRRLGQPYFPSQPKLGVSVSHTAQFVLVALGPGPLGIDVEQVRPRDFTAIQRAFTSAEWRLLQAQPKLARQRIGWQLWTAKEAVLKLVGCGLTQAPRRVEVLDLKQGVVRYQSQLYRLRPLALPAMYVGWVAQPMRGGRD